MSGRCGVRDLTRCYTLSSGAGQTCSSSPPLMQTRLERLLMTCVVRAWNTSRPLLFCPAMNTSMWQHPITAQQVHRLKEFGYVEIPCIAKKLVCGDKGKGAMAEVSTIITVIKQYLQQTSEASPQT
ncbi:phosphopantothenoylcysteine decarboxylase isoform X2 [Phycodurus eques]|uniref:phosphopantothenoylcysteine decarboxylase isoform X2 n=1 Tax=Phycodurus eques TaxID=693459 RepID=UPI002ACE476C|nr:phosphopantothenoylcysteine decarboxylase isoform X2 [Phycodurus eques]